MLKNGDFIRLEYDGYDDKGSLFDSTKGEVGKKLHGKGGPLLIVIGHYRMIRGLDELVRGMKKGEEREASFDSNRAFGSKNRNMVKVMSLADFKDHEVFPHPGLTIHIDTDEGRLFGTIKSVSGGRVMVDFNHPLADKKVRYKVKLVDVIETLEGKVKSLMDEAGVQGASVLNGKELALTLDRSVPDYDMKKAKLVIMARGFIPELGKIEVKETGEAQKTEGKKEEPKSTPETKNEETPSRKPAKKTKKSEKSANNSGLKP